MPVPALLRRLGVWPLPAVLTWALAWGIFKLALGQGAEPGVALGLASALGVGLSLCGDTWWRRVLIAAGFPLSLALSLPTLGLGNSREERLWTLAPLPAGAQVLDAGCGLGHGLQALSRAYPLAQLHGLEWSWPLRWWCALRCPWARVRQGDIWRADWSAYDMVYLFQRPESMARAAQKAMAELRPGAWLISLEFEATTLQASSQYREVGDRMVWLYRAPLTATPGE